MKALILNSGLGNRMGEHTSCKPKCMIQINETETILSRQLNLLVQAGISDVVITTGYYDEILVEYCQKLNLPLNYVFVKNKEYATTNYIYSIYCAREYLNDSEVILVHGDLVYESSVFEDIVSSKKSCMAVSSLLELPEKDFKAVVENGIIKAVGIEFFNCALAAQPLYKLMEYDWSIWLNNIISFCESNDESKRKCYAELALNEVVDKIQLLIYDFTNKLCAEVDKVEDLNIVKNKLKEIESRTVYMCFSTDILHAGHIKIIKKAAKLGKLIIGVLSDEAIISYKRFPIMSFQERRELFENLSDVFSVVEQKELSYRNNLEKYKPTYVVHGDDWVQGYQSIIRSEAMEVLVSYGGQLIEFPYSMDKKYNELDARMKFQLSLPDVRRRRLKETILKKGLITAIEAHSGITGLIAENTRVYQEGKSYQFDAMWISSLCDSTSKGKPDIELVDMTSRFRTIDDIMEVTTKPIIFDGDTGGLTEHFIYTVKTLERMGVSMVIIEDKTGLKKNSLFGTEVEQTQESIESFATKIMAGKNAQKTDEFMICARIESLILEQGMDDALMRAFAFADAGADAIMIHSRRKEPDEIFEFVEKFRNKNTLLPIVVVPTSFNSVTEEEFKKRGVNVVIYANQLTRSGFPAMQNAAKMILENHRAKECDATLMSIKDIINLIPEE